MLIQHDIIIIYLGQVFILSIPPKLAGDWFPENEANLATAIGVSANNLGVAAGCIWSPMAIMPDTMQEDIPWLLLLQVHIKLDRRPYMLFTLMRLDDAYSFSSLHRSSCSLGWHFNENQMYNGRIYPLGCMSVSTSS